MGTETDLNLSNLLSKSALTDLFRFNLIKRVELSVNESLRTFCLWNSQNFCRFTEKNNKKKKKGKRGDIRNHFKWRMNGPSSLVSDVIEKKTFSSRFIFIARALFSCICAWFSKPWRSFKCFWIFSKVNFLEMKERRKKTFFNEFHFKAKIDVFNAKAFVC